MVYDVVDVVGVEVLKDRNHNAAVGDGGHVGNAPAGIILSDDGNFVAPAQAAMFEQQVQAGYLLGHLPVGIAFVFAVIGVAGQVPVLTEAVLIQLDKILLYHCTIVDELCKSRKIIIIMCTFAMFLYVIFCHLSAKAGWKRL